MDIAMLRVLIESDLRTEGRKALGVLPALIGNAWQVAGKGVQR